MQRLLPSLAKIAASLLILANFASASGWQAEVYYWTGLSVLIAASFIGITYMVGSFFELRLLEAWTKVELQELFAGVLIAVFCVGMIASADAAASFLSGKQMGAGQYALDAIAKIREDGRALYLKLATAYFNVARYASYTYTAGLNLHLVSTSFTQTPGAGFAPLIAELGFAMDGIANYLLFLSAQKSFVIFFVNTAAIFLPVGIFLRCFSLTRKIGGTILGASIAASVIYPASFAISHEIYATFSPQIVQYIEGVNVLPDIRNPPLTNFVCDPVMQSFIQSPLGVVVSAISSSVGGSIGSLVGGFGGVILSGENGWALLICPVLQVTTGYPLTQCWADVRNVFAIAKAGFSMMMYPFLSLYSYVDIDAAIANVTEYALPATSIYGVLALVFSLLPIIIGVVAARNFIIYFGGEPQLYGLSKLV